MRTTEITLEQSGMMLLSEAAAMLTDAGISPGDLDFSLFLIESLQHT